MSNIPTKDTAVSHVDEPQPPMPAEGAPYAFVVVERTFSPYADRFECRRDAIVIPEWDHKELENWRNRPGYALIPIGPDGDTGTRAIVEPAPAKPALRMVEDGLYRNHLGAELRLSVPAYRSTPLRHWQVMAPGLWTAIVVGSIAAWLVTAEGLAESGYTLVTEAGSDGE